MIPPSSDPRGIDFLTMMNPLPRQLEALKAVQRHKFILYGGSAGGGKSRWLRWALLGLVLNWTELHRMQNIRVGLFSADYPTLRDRQISKIAAEFPMELGRVCETQADGLCFKIHDSGGGGAILLRNLDDPGKYKSSEYAAVAVEELTECEEQVFHDLHFRLRWPGIENTKFLAATNPNGIGHLWVKRYWITGDLPPELRQQYPHDFAYVPAKATDNPHNADSYITTLDSLPSEMRAAVRDGSWDLVHGMQFSEFRREHHVCAPFAIPKWWEKWGSNDAGHGEPAAWHCNAQDKDGNVYVFKEFTFHGETKATYSEQAKQVAAATKDDDIAFWVTGQDSFNPHPETHLNIIDYYNQGGLYGFIKGDTGAGALMRRAAVLHEYMKLVPDGFDGKPRARLRIFDTCKKLIETMPALPSNPKKMDEVLPCAIDHWYEGFSRGLLAKIGTPVEAPKKYPDGTYGAIDGTNERLAREAGEETEADAELLPGQRFLRQRGLRE